MLIGSLPFLDAGRRDEEGGKGHIAASSASGGAGCQMDALSRA